MYKREGDFDLFDEEFVVPPKRWCALCKSPLSMYNKTDRCNRHGLITPQEQSTMRRSKRKKPDKTQRADMEGLTQLTHRKLCEIIARVCDVSAERIMTRKLADRDPVVLCARRVYVYLLYTDLRLTYEVICQLLKMTPNNTLHLLRSARKRMLSSDEINEVIDKVRRSYVSSSTISVQKQKPRHEPGFSHEANKTFDPY